MSRKLLLLLTLGSPTVFAWGPDGHRIVGELAQRQLTPTAETEVARLLKPEGTTRLADIANWPDTLRNDPQRWGWSFKLHYVNLHAKDCAYQPAIDCPNGECVVAAIDRYSRILADRQRSARERREALKFLVHFVGDIHQPLHAGYARGDKGGNIYQVNYLGKGDNLHGFWDSGLLRTHDKDWQGYAKELATRPQPAGASFLSPAVWAEESCKIVRAGGVYPRTHKISKRYVNKQLPVAEERLQQAGQRLAKLLNKDLS